MYVRFRILLVLNELKCLNVFGKNNLDSFELKINFYFYYLFSLIEI